MRASAQALFCAVLFTFVSAVRVDAQTAACGNGILEPGEECDEGAANGGILCSATCLLVPQQRANQLKLQSGTTALCSQNALGAAIQSFALSSVQTSIDSTVTNGSTSIMFTQGTSLGIVNGAPVPASGYNGNNDLDWWYGVNAADLAGSGPASALPYSISAGVLTAGPGPANLDLDFGSGPQPIHLSSVNVTATLGAASTVLESTNATPPGWPPGHVPSGLTQVGSWGDSITGQLCGNMSAASLATVPAPAALLSGSLTACIEGYPVNSSLLDILVGGCHAAFITLVAPTQPDQQDPGAPAAGAGPPYTLVETNHQVTSCQDHTATAVPLATCLLDAAYSSFFKFSSDRVIARTNACWTAPIASNDGPVCAGQDVHLSASGPAGTFLWTGPNSFVSALQNPTIPAATTAASGTYNVTVTYLGCTTPAGSTVVTVNGFPATPSIAAPATAGPGQSGLTASVAAHAGSTYNWSITNGSITGGQGTSQITFTAGSSGSTDLGVVETASSGCSSQQGTASVAIVFSAPQNVFATAKSPTSVSIAWSATVGAATYEVVRQDVGVVGATASLSFTDTTAAANTAYLYTVRARDASNNPSPFSSPDLATTVIFTDDPLAAATTIVKAAHVDELRTAVNAVRALAMLGAFSFTDPTLTTDTTVQAVHVGELRTALDQARSSLGLPALTYTDPTLTPGATFIRAAHLQEIREGVK